MYKNSINEHVACTIPGMAANFSEHLSALEIKNSIRDIASGCI